MGIPCFLMQSDFYLICFMGYSALVWDLMGFEVIKGLFQVT